MKSIAQVRGAVASVLMLTWMIITVLVALVAPRPALADEAPASLLSLFARLPELPRTAQEATQWVSPQGKLIHAGLLTLKADIQLHQQAVMQIGQTASQRHQASAVRTVDDLAAGMADAGIDMARMQRDAAYAQQMQARIGRLSPQEMLALSQRMARPMNQDTQRHNEAQTMVQDEPAVQAAAAAGRAYSQALPARAQARQALWQEAETAASAVRIKPLQTPLAKPKPEWEIIGCEAACRALWQAYADQMLPRMLERDTAILAVRSAALQRQRKLVAEELKTADAHLVAARYGAAARSQANHLAIHNYDGLARGELLQIIDRITDTVVSAAAVAHCGTQIVLAPLAQCR